LFGLLLASFPFPSLFCVGVIAGLIMHILIKFVTYKLFPFQAGWPGKRLGAWGLGLGPCTRTLTKKLQYILVFATKKNFVSPTKSTLQLRTLWHASRLLGIMH
jgi:hypothetical protein